MREFKRIPEAEAIKKIEAIYRARIEVKTKEELIEEALRDVMRDVLDLPLHQLSNLMSALDHTTGVIRTDLGDTE